MRWFLVGLMVLSATFNNISVISWWSVLLVEETGVPGENHRPFASDWQTLSHNVGFDLTTLAVIDTDCTGRLNPTTMRSRPRRPLNALNYTMFLPSNHFFVFSSCLFGSFNDCCSRVVICSFIMDLILTATELFI